MIKPGLKLRKRFNKIVFVWRLDDVNFHILAYFDVLTQTHWQARKYDLHSPVSRLNTGLGKTDVEKQTMNWAFAP